MSFPSPGDPPDPGIKPPSPALASGLFTTVPPGKPMQLQAEGLVKAKLALRRMRGAEGSQVSTWWEGCFCIVASGLIAPRPTAQSTQLPVNLGEMPPVRGLPPPPCPRGSAARRGLCQLGTLRTAAQRSAAHPPAQGRAGPHAGLRVENPLTLETARCLSVLKGRSL